MGHQGTLPGAPEPKRPRPYVWASWLTKLLAGEEHCARKIWHKVHFKYTKTADDADRAAFFKEWTEKHDKITARRAEELREEGYVVRIEDDAEFKLKGANADVAGKPDLVGIRDGKALIVDAKSGRRRASDHWQVAVYLFSLPMAWLKGVVASGEVEYQDGRETVSYTPRHRDAIVGVIKTVSGDVAPDYAPSARECRYCDVASCPVRYKAPEGDASQYF